MEEQITSAIDEIVRLLRQCENSDDRVDQFLALRDRFVRDARNTAALDELRILSAPKGFLGNFPHTPKLDSGLTRIEVRQEACRLVQLTWDALDDGEAQQPPAPVLLKKGVKKGSARPFTHLGLNLDEELGSFCIWQDN